MVVAENVDLHGTKLCVFFLLKNLKLITLESSVTLLTHIIFSPQFFLLTSCVAIKMEQKLTEQQPT